METVGFLLLQKGLSKEKVSNYFELTEIKKKKDLNKKLDDVLNLTETEFNIFERQVNVNDKENRSPVLSGLTILIVGNIIFNGFLNIFHNVLNEEYVWIGIVTIMIISLLLIAYLNNELLKDRNDEIICITIHYFLYDYVNEDEKIS